MHKHKLGLARNGRALMCVLPDCHTSGKPFVVAGGDMAPGPGGDECPSSPETRISILETKVSDLQKQIDSLRRILAGRGMIAPRHGC